MAHCSLYSSPQRPADAATPPRRAPEDVLRAQAIMRNILLALLALCFGAATAAKQALDDKTIRVGRPLQLSRRVLPDPVRVDVVRRRARCRRRRLPHEVPPPRRLAPLAQRGKLKTEHRALNFLARHGDNGVVWHILTYWRPTE